MNIEITIANDLSNAQLEQLHQIINATYISSERDFWKEGYERIGLNELRHCIQQENLLVAFEEENVVGCVRVGVTSNGREQGIGEFSMLCVDFAARGKGIASKLVEQAEQWTLNQKLNSIQLQLLLPMQFTHSDKEMLKAWYGNIGYKCVREARFADFHPELIPIMKIDCVFEVWEKQLLGSVS